MVFIGNLGNVMVVVLVWLMGLLLGWIVLVINVNDVLLCYFYGVDYVFFVSV